jgi:hypothetical protein
VTAPASLEHEPGTARSTRTLLVDVWRNSYARLFVASMLAGLVLAVMTGPEGSATAPLSGITGSLSAPRVYWFLAVGLVLFVVRAGWLRFGSVVTQWTRGVRGRMLHVLAATPRRVVADLALIGFGFVYVSWISPHDPWKGGLCIQFGASLLALEVVSLALRTGRPRVARILIYGFVALYGALAWLTGPVSRYLDTIGVVLHNPVLGKTLLATAGFLVTVELLVVLLGSLRARAARRRGRGVLVGLGVVLVAYGFLTWTSWSQWDAKASKSLASFLSRDHLLVHAPTAGVLLMALGAALVLGGLGWLIADAADPDATRTARILHRYHAVDRAQGALGKPALVLFVLLLALEWPLHMSTSSLSNINLQIMPYVLLGLGLNVVIGWAGLLDLGYIAFYAIGAYTTAYFTGALPVHPPFILSDFWLIPFAIAAAMLAGVLLGTPTLRLRGDYLAIVTLGFGEIIFIFATNLTGITGGSFGASGIPYFNFHVLTPILKAGQQWSAISYLPELLPALGRGHRQHGGLQLPQQLEGGPNLDRAARGRARGRLARHQRAQVQGDGLRDRRVHGRLRRGLRREPERPVPPDLVHGAVLHHRRRRRRLRGHGVAGRPGDRRDRDPGPSRLPPAAELHLVQHARPLHLPGRDPDRDDDLPPPGDHPEPAPAARDPARGVRRRPRGRPRRRRRRGRGLADPGLRLGLLPR